MKKLVELYGVPPGPAAELEAQGVYTVRDLSNFDDLPKLSESSGISAEKLQQWKELAISEQEKKRRRQRQAGLWILLVVLLAFVSSSLVWSELEWGGKRTSHTVHIDWQPSASKDVAGYNVYRQSGNGPLVKINPGLVTGTSFVDSSVESGQTYAYQVSAVNSQGMESAPSAKWLAAVP